MKNGRRGYWAWVALLALPVLGACAGDPAKRASEPAATSEPASKTESPKTGAPKTESPKDEPSKATAKMPTAQPMGGGKEATGMNETTDLSAGQCDDLEKILVGLIHRDLASKIDPKMDASHRSDAEKEAAAVAKKTAAQFGDNCRANMAGKAVKREMLQCMFKAKELTAFEGCNR